MNVQKWKIINKDYLDYLRENYESRIPRTDYGNDKLKPFFGELMRVGDLAYVTQVSSAKPRHNKIKANIDFQKIIHNDVLIAVVNLNYMFPVPVSEMTDLEYEKIEEYVDFKNDTAKSKYIDLLKREMKYIKELPLENNARSLYALKYDKPEHIISKRCFDFKTLENGAHNWTEKLIK